MGCLAVILIAALAYSLSWAITVGIIKLICFCFGIAFSLKIATGIWIILCLLKEPITVRIKGD